MFTCLYNKRSICSLDVLNKYGVEIYDIKKEWKKAQLLGELRCDECGSPLIFKPGKGTNAPHFSHKTGVIRDCYYDHVSETAEHKTAMELLNRYFTDKYADSLSYVKCYKKHANGKRSDIYFEFDNGEKLAVEFQKANLDFYEWDQRHAHYVEMGISELWFISISVLEKDRNNLEFLAQVLLHETKDQMAKFLDVDHRKVKLVKQIDYLDSEGIVKKQKLFEVDYILDDLLIRRNGEIVCDFDSLFEIEKERFFQECKLEESRAKDVLDCFHASTPSYKMVKPQSFNVIPQLRKNSFSPLTAGDTEQFSPVFNQWMTYLELGGSDRFTLVLGKCYESIESGCLNVLNSKDYARFSEKLSRCEDMIKKFDTLNQMDLGRLKIRLAQVSTVLLGVEGL